MSLKAVAHKRGMVAYVNLVRNSDCAYALQQDPHACDAITACAPAQRLHAVVWTALPSIFAEVAQRPFAIETATQYLKALTEPAKCRALEYPQKAPSEVVNRTDPSRFDSIGMG